MDRNIIIDGINVAGCEHHLSTGYCQLQMIFQGMVLKLPFGKHLEYNLCDKDCYYKQLKHLEQENFALTQESQQKSQTICELEQENKELKEECANLKSLIWYINCSGEIETVDCVISAYYESRNTQYEKRFWEKVCALKGKDKFKSNSALHWKK